MIRVQPGSIETLEDLRGALQSAIKLEHATIPPYLTAFFTLKGSSPGAKFAAQTLHDIFMEEMLHMHLAANILNAVGGSAAINDPAFVPVYPGPLPMGIGDGEPGGLTVGIKRYSRQTVKDTFMEIEEPEDKLDLPTRDQVRKALFAAAPSLTYETIGEFYLAIAAAIVKLDGSGPTIFTGDPGLQVPVPPPLDPITDVDSAIEAITTIISQGEGTSISPADGGPGDDLAHYYRYEELYRGMRLVPDSSAPHGYAFDRSRPIVVDETNEVIQMVDNR